MMRNDKQLTASVIAAELGGRPPIQIWGTRGMVSSMHPAASDVAAQILRSGGNAVDAAVALGIAISVTSHDWSGIAGDSAWLIYRAATNEFFYLDGYATCPAATTAQALRQHFDLDSRVDLRACREEPPERRHMGVVTGMTPGTPAAWHELTRRLGSRPFAELCEPGIALAESGVPINRYFSESLAKSAPKLLPFESTKRIVCRPDGKLLAEGDAFKQPELAATLRRLAEGGRDAFYEGETAKLIAEYCRTHDGLVTLDDLKRYQPIWRPVSRGSYRGSDVIVTTPPTAGVHVVQALNILEGFELSRLGYHSAQSLHVLIESLKVALDDRRKVGGDPDFMRMNIDTLIEKSYAGELRGKISMNHAAPLAAAEHSGSSTTHFVVADLEGNIVSATQTIGSRFGCGEVIAGTGMFMNDRTWWMSLDEGPNAVTPGHRANIGHAATMLMSNDRPYAALGSPGGFGIVQYIVQTIVNMIDYGLDIQSAIEAPRFRIEDLSGRVGFEQRFEHGVMADLTALGHSIFDYPPWSDRVGGMEGIYVDPASGHMLGGYDPRRNSMAVGIS